MVPHTFSYDPELYALIAAESERQSHTLNLIASENYVSSAVAAVSGSLLTNKYAEGYPGKRYYAGCGVIDQVEQLAIDRAKLLFGAEHVNVQPHAGSQANMAALFAVLSPGDTIMGMALREGGHLTHGHTVNFSGKLFSSVQYTVDAQTGLLDYDQIYKRAQQYTPRLIIAGASAYSRVIDFEKFATIAQSVRAYLLADIAHIAGPIAAGLHPSPVGHADIITSTTHKTLRGPRGGMIMCRASLATKIDRSIMPGMQGGPCMQQIGAKAVAFKQALSNEFLVYQQQTLDNAQHLARALMARGYTIVTGGTDNHLFVIDLRNKQMRGNYAAATLEKAGIIVSASCVPFDPEKPGVTSGIRIGTPAITTRGFTVESMSLIAQYIDDALKHPTADAYLKAIAIKVQQMCAMYQVPMLQNQPRQHLQVPHR